MTTYEFSSIRPSTDAYISCVSSVATKSVMDEKTDFGFLIPHSLTGTQPRWPLHSNARRRDMCAKSVTEDNTDLYRYTVFSYGPWDNRFGFPSVLLLFDCQHCTILLAARCVNLCHLKTIYMFTRLSSLFDPSWQRSSLRSGKSRGRVLWVQKACWPWARSVLLFQTSMSYRPFRLLFKIEKCSFPYKLCA